MVYGLWFECKKIFHVKFVLLHLCNLGGILLAHWQEERSHWFSSQCLWGCIPTSSRCPGGGWWSRSGGPVPVVDRSLVDHSLITGKSDSENVYLWLLFWIYPFVLGKTPTHGFRFVLHFLDLRMLKNYTSFCFFFWDPWVSVLGTGWEFLSHEKNGSITGWFKASLKKMEKQAVHAIDRKASDESCVANGLQLDPSDPRMTPIIDTTGCWTENSGVFPPNHPFAHRVFHYFHHPFWGTPIFWKHPLQSF